MPKFCITFGQRYRHEPHPRGMHPDGWLEIEAETRKDAVSAATEFAGYHWANIYDEDEMSFGLYPKGCLKKITVESKQQTYD